MLVPYCIPHIYTCNTSVILGIKYVTLVVYIQIHTQLWYLLYDSILILSTDVYFEKICNGFWDLTVSLSLILY